jgi:16S rRNA (uracil1498-N3)-methyltransferase
MRTLLVQAPVRTGEAVVEGDEAHHARAVLRLKVGDEVRVADGAGRAGVAVVSGIGREALCLEVTAIEELLPDRAALITVAVAAPKGDRLADLVRGLTELGVGTIQLLQTERGERLPGNADRLRRIAAEALKQCRRSHLPGIVPACTITALAASGALLRVLDRAGAPPRTGAPAPVTLVVGPEGGLTTAELAELAAAGAVATRLAGPILRIETAALAAAAVWAAAWESAP